MARQHAWIYAEEIRLLYLQQPIGMIATTVFGAALVVVHWGLVPTIILAAWYAAVVFAVLVRAAIFAVFWRAGSAKQHERKWEIANNASMAHSGLAWGILSIFPFFCSSFLHNALIAFVTMGMIAGAAATVSARRASYYCYAIPAFFPVAIVLLFPANLFHIMISTGMAIFFVLISLFSEKVYRMQYHSLTLRFNNNELLISLQQAKENTEQANASLRQEVDMRREAEEHLRELSASLEQQVRARTEQLSRANHELTAFSYSVSHDLRTPLLVIDELGKALQEDYGRFLDKEGTEYITRLRALAKRMSSIINDLLSLSRISQQELRREVCDLSQVAREIAAMLQSGDPDRQVAFVVQDDVKVSGDCNLLRLALENLLGNAWKYTAGKQDARIEFGARIEQGETVFFVIDNGAGFDMAYADRLFAPFQRLHRAEEFEGTGIGLATVQRIIHRHGGRIWAEGKTGKGAAFYFTLQ
jgi:signal transduction histidine kinase